MEQLNIGDLGASSPASPSPAQVQPQAAPAAFGSQPTYAQQQTHAQQQAYGQRAAYPGYAGQTYAQQQYAQQQAGYAGARAAYAPQPVYVAMPEQPKSKGWIVALVAVVLCFFAIVISFSTCANAFTSAAYDLGAGGASYESPADYLTGDTIGIIYLDGEIQYDYSVCSPEGLKEQLDIAENNDHIKAVVLRVDSGGGTATAGEEMAAYISQFSKPVVVSSASLNASAAYEISSQADYIYVAKTTEIGAIGTVMQSYDYSGLYDMLGIKVDNIASAESKDSSYGTRPLTDEERAYYQRLIDQVNECFIDNVAQGRDMSTEEVRALATGMVFSGTDAVENGLADDFGTFEDALDKAAELAGIEEYDTVMLDSYAFDYSSLFDLFAKSSTAEDLLQALKEAEGHDLTIR